MKFLIIGLGSMGKRRVRCLQALGHKEIVGFDPREDRRKEVETLYKIQTSDSLERTLSEKVNIIIISTPPDRHEPFLRLAVEHGIPAFVEASVVLGGLQDVDSQAKKKGVLLAPSCTLRYHPSIKEIKRIVSSGDYGKVTNFSYHSGQYLPDWHPWENVKDYYVSKRLTGGCREIVPFELTWMSDVFGHPDHVHCFLGSTMNVGADIDDTYAISLQYKNHLGLMMVDVVARHGTRHLILNLEQGQILWDWNWNEVRLFDAKNKTWISFAQKLGQAEAGYNKNIIEQMYIEELENFIDAALGKKTFPNTMEEDIRILEMLNEMDSVSLSKGKT